MLHLSSNLLGVLSNGTDVELKTVHGAGSRPLHALESRPLSALTIVAHDLRGPLTSLRLMVELIETHGTSRSVDKILSCTARAGAIIDGLEDLLNSVLERVRNTGDPLAFEPDTVRIDEVIRTAIETSRPVAADKSVDVVFDRTEPSHVNGDSRLLLQVFENLVGNAIKHSSTGMTVTCELHEVGSQVLLCIKDTGNGMTKRDLQRAFRPFTSLSSRSKDSSKSWGLGLWIVKLIVERHRGRIEARSGGIGAGTEFRILLPRAQ